MSDFPISIMYTYCLYVHVYNGTYTNDVEKTYMYRLATDTTFGKEAVMLILTL